MKATSTTNILQGFKMNLVQVDAVTLKMKAALSSQTFDQTHYTTPQNKKRLSSEQYPP